MSMEIFFFPESQTENHLGESQSEAWQQTGNKNVRLIQHCCSGQQYRRFKVGGGLCDIISASSILGPDNKQNN